MSSPEFSSVGDVMATDLVDFCRSLDLLKPFCRPDRRDPDLSTFKHPLSDGRLAEVTIWEIESEIPDDEDPETVETVDNYTIYKLDVAEDAIGPEGKGTRIQKQFNVYEPASAPDSSYPENAATCYITNDAGANWHEQQSIVISQSKQAEIHRQHGEDDEAHQLQVEINAALSRGRELSIMLGEGPNSRAHYLAAMSVIKMIYADLGVAVE